MLPTCFPHSPHRSPTGVFGEPSRFLIGWTLYSGSKKLRSTCSGNIRPIRLTLPLIGWEQSSPVNEEEIKVKMDHGVARIFNRFGGNFFICWLVGGAVLSRGPRMRCYLVELPCEGWLKYTDLTLACIFDHAVCCASAVRAEACISLQASWERGKVRRTVRTMFCELKVQLRNESQFVELSEVCSANKHSSS